MSYYEQAKGINQDLTQLFNSIYIREFTIEQRERILNIMIRLGQVAKFRCRSNTAYDNFIRQCLDGIADAKRFPLKAGEEFEILTATMKPLTNYKDFLIKNSLQDNKENFTTWVKSIRPAAEVI